MFFFDNSTPERRKRAGIKPILARSAVPVAKPYELLTVEELTNGGDRTFISDTESYPNYFLAAFQCAATKKVIYFEDSPTASVDTKLLAFLLHRFLIVGFNSRDYDFHVLSLALDGCKAETIKARSDTLIAGERPEFDWRLSKVNHIDLIEVAPITASLKIYAGRLHCHRMQDLPYEPDRILTQDEAVVVRDYCINDLDNTHLLYDHLKPQIVLRETLGDEYGIDLRSKSDAQVAEAVIVGELRKRGIKPSVPTVEPGRRFRLRPIPGLAFQTPGLQGLHSTTTETDFEILPNGSVANPGGERWFKVRVGKADYQMGVGGLHSCEESVSYFATDETLLVDRDVASYYPRLLINQGLYPKHLGPEFLKVYIALVERRLAAKLDSLRKAEAEGLKIAVNGGIGKLQNIWSKLYDPPMNIQITVPGQLYLLMQIEALELAGFQVVSANTDGVVSLVPKARYAEFLQIIEWWERETGFVTEETRYRSIHCRDVNNYIAVKLDGICKVKGIYSERGSALNSPLSKNPECLVVSDALQAFVSKGTSVDETIYECRDIRRFVAVRTVKGGGYKDGVYLGRAVRWYYAVGCPGELNYVASGNAVPKSTGARPLMELPDNLPLDLDFDHYINQANEALYDIGVYKRPTVGRLF